ncbi:MAG: sugar ABC transporter permease [bacterium]|nr:sugar ABC transporter permease [bacterium]
MKLLPDQPNRFSPLNLILLAAASLMLIAFVFLPLGDGLSGATFLTDPSSSDANMTPALFLLPLAAVSALLMAIWMVYDPPHREVAAFGLMLSGLIGLAYFAVYALNHGSDLSTAGQLAGSGFVVLLVIALVLTFQYVLPRPRLAAAEDSGFMIDLLACIFLNSFLIVLGVMAAAAVFQREDFFDLGRPVQTFAGLVCLLPVLFGVVSSLLLIQRHPDGRYITLAAYLLGGALSGFYLLQLWGVFIGIDDIANALYQNAIFLVGVAAAYGLIWLAGRLSDKNPWQGRLETIAGGVGMLSLLLLLWRGGALQGIGSVLDTYGDSRVWVVTLLAAAFVILFWRLLHRGAEFHETPDQQAAWQGWLMLAPNIIGFLLFFAGPLLLSFYLSFTNDTVGNVPSFTGLENYFAAFRDELFLRSLWNTFVFCLMLVPLAVIPALALSIILNSKIPGMKIFRAIYFLPSVAAVVGTALIWRWLYDPVIGFFNYIGQQIVTFLNSTFGTSLADPNIQWLTDGRVMLFSIVLLAAWQVIGFNTVLFLAGLQGIPRELYEAAYVDGAGRWRQFLNVTLPLLGPTTFFVVITTVITGLQVFNEPYALIFQRPMPEAARTAVFHLYDMGFSRFEFGYASAVAWILFAVIFTVTLLQFRINRSRAYEG